MIKRRILLVFSIAVSFALHGLLIAYSDRLALLAMASTGPQTWEPFRVDLTEHFPETVPEPEAAPAASMGMPAAPATIEELLERETAPLPLADEELLAKVDLPLLSERIAEETLEREHNFELNEETQADIDAKILEITRAEARQDIEVPRKLVRPSGARVLAEDEFPTFNVEGASPELITFSPLGGTSFGSEPATGTEAAGASLAESMLDLANEPESLASLDVEPRLPEMDIEERLARGPLVEELKAENPYDFFDDMVTIEVDSYIPPNEAQGYFRLRISPRKGSNAQILPKDVTFVLDASNSIAQRKLDQTAKGLAETIRMLRPDDRFNIVVFRDTPNFFRSDRVNATRENQDAALEYLKGLKSYGETDVFSAIQPVIHNATRDGYPGMVFVVTDGRPTKGLRDGRMIINNVTEENDKRNPIYAFSGGRTVNRYLLDLLAYRNKGEAFVAPEIENMSGDLPTFFKQLNDPLLVDLHADLTSIDATTVFPKELPDFFLGRAVTVYGRFTPARDKELAMRLVGRAGTKEKEVIFRADLEKAKTGDQEIARSWAFRKVYNIIGQMCEVGETPELLAQLRQLSRQYNIRTSYDGG